MFETISFVYAFPKGMENECLQQQYPSPALDPFHPHDPLLQSSLYGIYNYRDMYKKQYLIYVKFTLLQINEL